ncbi:MAG: VOC family protein [Boseongicola sp.]|nr:VOC family protein [Boseongicola sp.]
MTNRIDHFTFGAAILSEGRAVLSDLPGVTVPCGSRHVEMSTRKCVCQAGNESFFEFIAVDPAAPDPGRARRFTLDVPETRARNTRRPRAFPGQEHAGPRRPCRRAATWLTRPCVQNGVKAPSIV